MVLEINYLIYLYIILCICVLLFDIFYAVRKRWRRNAEPKNSKRYRKVLLALLQEGAQPLSTKRLTQWFRRLNTSANLLSFHEAVESLLAEEAQRPAMELWLQNNKDLFMMLSRPYLKKREPVFSTFFAYLIWQYRLCGKSATDRFVIMTQELCLRPSLYCRENALCALYACGQAQHVVKAYILLSQHQIEHSAKLVTDGLLQFAGDKDALVELLLKQWDEFPPYYQVCFLNFARMASGRFSASLYALLLKKGVDDEVQFAVIRYLRTHPYPDAAPLLQRLVKEWNRDDWEFAAIAALSLEAYPNNDTLRALMEGCRSSNWHVRENASDSLIKLVNESLLKRIILAEKDRYAKDMLQYKLLKRIREATK